MPNRKVLPVAVKTAKKTPSPIFGICLEKQLPNYYSFILPET